LARSRTQTSLIVPASRGAHKTAPTCNVTALTRSTCPCYCACQSRITHTSRVEGATFLTKAKLTRRDSSPLSMNCVKNLKLVKRTYLHEPSHSGLVSIQIGRCIYCLNSPRQSSSHSSEPQMATQTRPLQRVRMPENIRLPLD